MNVVVALGFAPHSGWAAVVAVRLDAGGPSIVYRGRVEMTDAKLAGSKQPYHAVESLPLPEARRRLGELDASAARKAKDGIRSVVEALARRQASPTIAGILDASGRKAKDLDSILASHALIHSADGEHFRRALQMACEETGIAVVRVKKRELEVKAAEALEVTTDERDTILRNIGKPLGPPWGADQKSAALLAWLLASGSR